MIERNELGVKTGKGFYTYPNPEYKNPDFLKGSMG
jgi:3-hydroxybutyryl-CoA dehydrogenase